MKLSLDGMNLEIKYFQMKFEISQQNMFKIYKIECPLFYFDLEYFSKNNNILLDCLRFQQCFHINSKQVNKTCSKYSILRSKSSFVTPYLGIHSIQRQFPLATTD